MIPGYKEFEFDLPGALLAKLIELFNSLGSAPLSEASLKGVPDTQGVYQLFMGGSLVYIGKTDAEAGLHKRLIRHLNKIQHRNGLDPLLVSFKAIRVYVFTAMDLEEQLIKHYGGVSTVSWNGSGFGSNDPGRRRDLTIYKPDHFDALYKIDIDRMLDIDYPAEVAADVALNRLKAALPYVLRFEASAPNSRKAHQDLANSTITFASPAHWTTRQLIQNIISQLPPGWQATQLPSHVIVYKESKVYPQGVVIARS